MVAAASPRVKQPSRSSSESGRAPGPSRTTPRQCHRPLSPASPHPERGPGRGQAVRGFRPAPRRAHAPEPLLHPPQPHASRAPRRAAGPPRRPVRPPTASRPPLRAARPTTAPLHPSPQLPVQPISPDAPPGAPPVLHAFAPPRAPAPTGRRLRHPPCSSPKRSGSTSRIL